MHHIAIFASGDGTNAENIIRYFQNHPQIQVSLVVYNRKEAGVRLRTEAAGVATVFHPKEAWNDEAATLALLRRYGIDFIVLSGFLLLIPAYLIRHFEGRIVNIHPSLIPRHCGRGMYGNRVHEAVLASGDSETGITIHMIDEEYDHGHVVMQAKCPVLAGDTVEELAARVHALEYRCYPEAIERLLLGLPSNTTC